VRGYTRHQLKQDQFTATAKETVSWAVEHRDKLMYGGGAIVVVAALALGTWIYWQQQDESAGVALGHAMTTSQAPLRSAGQPPEAGTTSFATASERAKAARDEFAKIADNYPHTHSAEMARYFMGLMDSESGNNAAAETELKQAASSRRQDLAALAKMALAQVYRSTGREAQAVSLYQELMAHPTNTVGKSVAQLALASLYEAKAPQDARKIYMDVQKDDPRGAAGEIANTRLATLK